MPGTTIERLLEETERFEPEIRGPGLLHIARALSAEDRDEALRLFDEGLKTIRQVPGRAGALLAGQASVLAAAVAPERINSVSVPHVAFSHHEPELLVRTMLEHGHTEAATEYLLRYEGHDGCPFLAVLSLIRRPADDGTRTALLRRAVDAWRNAPEADFRRSEFTHIFEAHWRLLPPQEARALLHEMIGQARRQQTVRVDCTYDPEGQVRITNLCEHTLFKVLHICRALDPSLAESLIASYPEFDAAVRRFPNGVESVREEVQAAAVGKAPGGGSFFIGDPGDFPFFQNLIDAERGNTDFEVPFAHALERYMEDSSTDPNPAPREFWASTAAFRTVLYRATKRIGRDAAAYLPRIPDPAIRLFTAIEIEAAVRGLPEFSSVIVRLPTTDPGSDVEDDIDDDNCGPHIRCPKCGWHPRKDDRWMCTCGHRWNTFDTGGVCPGCMRQWTETQCPQCGQWSPHSDWYVRD